MYESLLVSAGQGPLMRQIVLFDQPHLSTAPNNVFPLCMLKVSW